MSDRYKTISTSNVSAKVEDREISRSQSTRKIIRSELIENPKNVEACVKVTILHQRKKVNDQWEDIESVPLTKMKAGETMKMGFDSEETLKMAQELKNLYAIFDGKGIPWGEKEVVVGFDSEVIKTDPERAKVIKALLRYGYSEEVWQELVQHTPDLATKFCLIRLHEQRVAALSEFEESLRKDKDEGYWQQFFETNTWIFGYGLKYKFLKTVQSQPHFGGTSVKGTGGQRGDYLTASAAEVKFTVLVEVKKPSSLLLGQQYRNSAYPPSSELAGGIAQVQANCRKWEIEGSRTDENRELLVDEGISSIHPRGILIIGQTKQLSSQAQKTSFELLRRNLSNPEVLTFDELMERARFIVKHTDSDSEV